MSRTVTIRSLPEAFAVIKEMEAEDCEWGEDYRAAGRAAVAEILERQMALSVDRHLAEMAARGAADRRQRLPSNAEPAMTGIDHGYPPARACARPSIRQPW